MEQDTMLWTYLAKVSILWNRSAVVGFMEGLLAEVAITLIPEIQI